MNCNRFRRDLPDWLRGGLNENEAGALRAHSAECRACAREEALERHLRGVWSSMPAPTREPELWPRVAAALDGPAPGSRPQWFPARLAVGSVFALGALCALLLSQNGALAPPDNGPTPFVATGTLTIAEEQKVVRMVNELRELPELEAERLALEPPHLRNAAMFLGEGERELNR